VFEGLFQPMHLLVIFGIGLLVFGPRRLPELGKGLGEAIRGFAKSFNGAETTPSTPVTRGDDAFGSPLHQSPSTSRIAPRVVGEPSETTRPVY
jgi:sec-independent protein translocase protein TatA